MKASELIKAEAKKRTLENSLRESTGTESMSKYIAGYLNLLLDEGQERIRPEDVRAAYDNYIKVLIHIQNEMEARL